MTAIKLGFGSPEYGWLSVELSGPGGEVTLEASDVPGDSLAMLADAACDVMNGCPARVVTWFLEPAEHTWRFHLAHGLIEVWAQTDRRAATCIGKEAPLELCWAIWRALHLLEEDEAWHRMAEGVWSNPFPVRSTELLHQQLQQRRS